MVVMLASIGVRDPESESGPMGPLRLVREGGIVFDEVYLFANTDVLSQAAATEERIRETSPAAVHIVELPGDPSDIDGVMGTIYRKLPPLGAGDEVHVCASSGTPQIGLALTLAAQYRYPHAVHWQALDPGRAQPPFLRRAGVDSIRHFDEVQRGLLALEEMRFPTALAIFEERCASQVTPARAKLAALQACRALAGALVAAANLDVKQAFLWAAQAKPNRLGAAKEAIEQVQAWYQSLKNGASRNKNWPVELLALAERDYASGDLTGATTYAAMAYEVGLVVRLRKLGVDPDSVAPEIADRLEQSLPRLKRPPSVLITRFQGYGDLGRIEGLERLAAAVLLLESEGSGLDYPNGHSTLRDLRNHLVHAARMPARAPVESALAFVAETFERWGWHHTTCPTRPEKLRALVSALRKLA